MIVTPRTTDAQTKHALAQHINRVVDREKMIGIDIKSKSPRDAQIASGSDQFGVTLGSCVVLRQKISRDLFAKELVVRLV